MGNCFSGPKEPSYTSPPPGGSSSGGDQPKKSKGKRVKILLLGAGESGKSTIAKQLKILHLRGFKEEEIMLFKKQIYQNVLTNIRLLIKGAEDKGIPLDNQDLARKVYAADYMAYGVLTPEIAAEIKTLWERDAGVKAAYARGTEFHLIESSNYYFDNLDRLAQAGYRPTNEDILKSRRLTVGAEELEFSLDGYTFHIIDVGGQKGEREKWMDYFQNNHAVIFFVALSEYDQKLAEDNSTNRMSESLKLFSDVCNHQWFADAAVILFLNKSDVFAQKITHTPITCAFPEYSGPNQFDAASQYIQNKFVERISNKRKKVYPFITNATNTDNFKNIFGAVKDIVVTQMMQTVGVGI